MYHATCGVGHAMCVNDFCVKVGLDGRGLPRKAAEAALLYRRACEGGVGQACFNYAQVLVTSCPHFVPYISMCLPVRAALLNSGV